jgi:ribosomal-protein-alanine N-acetyltransferase
MIRFETTRLVISDHEAGDLEAMHRLLSDAETMKFMPDIMTHSLEESRVNLTEAVRQSLLPDRTKYFFKMVMRETGDYVGDIGYTVTDGVPGGLSVHLGYFIRPEYHGRGLTTEAGRAVFDYAFGTGGVSVIRTGCDRRNIASEHVMIKFGMIRDSVSENRVDYLMTNKGWQDRLNKGFLSTRSS